MLVVDSVFSMGEWAGYFLSVAGIIIRRSFLFPLWVGLMFCGPWTPTPPREVGGVDPKSFFNQQPSPIIRYFLGLEFGGLWLE